MKLPAPVSAASAGIAGLAVAHAMEIPRRPSPKAVAWLLAVAASPAGGARIQRSAHVQAPTPNHSAPAVHEQGLDGPNPEPYHQPNPPQRFGEFERASFQELVVRFNSSELPARFEFAPLPPLPELSWDLLGALRRHGSLLEGQLPSLPSDGPPATEPLGNAHALAAVRHNTSLAQLDLPTPYPMPTVGHTKKPGSGRERAPAPIRQQPEAAPTATAAEQDEWGAYVTILRLVMAHVLLALAVVLTAYLYRAHGRRRYQKHSAPLAAAGFAHGLLQWRDLKQDWPIYTLAIFCAPIRWADTLNRAQMLPFWTGLAVMTALFLLVPATFGITMVFVVSLGVYWRQQLRSLFGYSHHTATSLSQDCLAWTFCCLCAIAQEAREVEHVQREPPLVRLSNAQFADGATRSRGSAPSISSASSQPASAAPIPQAMQRGAPSLPIAAPAVPKLP